MFAVIIALVGCYQGFQVSGSADSVGRQTTLSVVQSIFLVIVTDALFSIVFSWLEHVSAAMQTATRADAVIEIRNLNTRFGDAVVHEDVSLAVRRGEIFALVGASGCGKSTLLREIIVLQQPRIGLDPGVRQEVVGLERRGGAAAAAALGRDVRARGVVQLAHGDAKTSAWCCTSTPRSASA